MLQEMYFVIVIGSVALKQKPRGITQERVISEIFLIPPLETVCSDPSLRLLAKIYCFHSSCPFWHNNLEHNNRDISSFSSDEGKINEGIIPKTLLPLL